MTLLILMKVVMLVVLVMVMVVVIKRALLISLPWAVFGAGDNDYW